MVFSSLCLILRDLFEVSSSWYMLGSISAHITHNMLHYTAWPSTSTATPSMKVDTSAAIFFITQNPLAMVDWPRKGCLSDRFFFPALWPELKGGGNHWPQGNKNRPRFPGQGPLGAKSNGNVSTWVECFKRWGRVEMKAVGKRKTFVSWF